MSFGHSTSADPAETKYAFDRSPGRRSTRKSACVWRTLLRKSPRLFDTGCFVVTSGGLGDLWYWLRRGVQYL